MPKAKKVGGKFRTFDARPDTPDFRDRMYVPTLVEVPVHITLDQYRAQYPDNDVPVLNQGREGACTGFAAAATVHFLLRSRAVVPDDVEVSPRMLYEMAKRYDEWEGVKYDGSSVRGAMKGWHKHGVCSAKNWPYRRKPDRRLTNKRAVDGLRRPLGAYFRVNHRDIVAMHTALAEVGILNVSALVHTGWGDVEDDGLIEPGGAQMGGHAFVIVAYDQRGFWIQNSWGKSWGRGGFALLTYDDWLENGRDVWVARLGAPIELRTGRGSAAANAGARSKASVETIADLRPHIVSLGNDGQLSEKGPFATTREDLKNIFEDDIPRITKGWAKKRILLYAHGGLTPAKTATQRVAEYRAALLANQVYPLAFVWRSDLWSTLENILKDALSRRRDEGVFDDIKDFMLDRLDDALEPIARIVGGRALWSEMKENATMATTSRAGGARLAAQHLAKLVAGTSNVEIHLAGHSAGGVFMAPLAQLLASKGVIRSGPMRSKKGLGLRVSSSTLWAPACTTQLFKDAFLPLITKKTLRNFALFTLTDEAEQDDHCAKIYNKSLLYLVSNAFEDRFRVPLLRDGEPILGMEKWINDDPELKQTFSARGPADWVLSPNTFKLGSPKAARARTHGAFDDDTFTVRATLARILGVSGPKKTSQEVTFFETPRRLESRLRDLAQRT